MLNVTLYVPGANPVTVCGAFHDCPGRPSISTVAPIGTDDTINWPSLGAGGGAGATRAFFAARPDRPAYARGGGDCVCACDSGCVCVPPATDGWLNGAGAVAAEFAGSSLAFSVETPAGRC